MINFNHYVKPHDNGNGGGVTYINGGINNADLPADLTVTSITADKGDIKRLNGQSMTYNNGGFVYISADDGTIKKLRGGEASELNYDIAALGEVHSGTIDNEGKITTADLKSLKAYIDSLQSHDITTEYLTVTKQAHFFELIIDKIKSTNGAIMVTQANCSLDYVKAFNSNNQEVALDANNVAYYWAYWEATDKNGKSISNDWWPYDQAICMSFNDVQVGANYNVQSKYYWRLVEDKTNSPVYMNINTGELADQGTRTDRNTIHFNNPTLRYTIDEAGTPTSYNLMNGWNTYVQKLNDDPEENERLTGCTWTQTSGGIGEVTQGVITTKNTIWGIQLEPILEQSISGTTIAYDNDLASYIPDKFSFTTTENCRLNVGIYYSDGNSQYFPAPEKGHAKTLYELDLVTTAPIEAIVITNADDVAWHLMNGIKLSNTDYDAPSDHTGDLAYEDLYANKSSIPSIGDNVVQLGYRYDHYSQSDRKYDVARASAIIISAYKTPDQGGTDPWGKSIDPITPPSYAQYKNITDYKLPSHRHTYFDADNASFIGSFYTSTHEEVGEKGPQGDQGPQGPRGFQGGTIKNVYANWPSGEQGPQMPADGTTVEQLDADTTQPWRSTSTTPDFANGYFTWMCENEIDGNGNYGEWRGLTRITGDNGKDGEDGDSTEFIYKSYDSPQSFGNDNYNPAYWNASQTDDYVGPSNGPQGYGYNWYDHPQGVQSDMPYEYVAQRKKYTPSGGTQAVWSQFGSPSLWSKYGQNGRDGDGVEYIFKHFAGPQSFGSDDNNPAHWDPNQNDEYYGPSDGPQGYEYNWYDDPQGVQADMPYEYVAQRKKIVPNGGTQAVWGKYGDPALWANYSVGTQGPQGNTGAQGTNGRDGQTYTLIDQGSQAYMSSFLNETTGEITTQFTLDLSYKVDMLVGGEAHLMTVQEAENQECDPNWPNTSTPFYAYVAWYKPGTGNGLYYWKMSKLSNYSDIQNFTYNQRYSNNSNTTTAIEQNNSVIVALVRTPIDSGGSQHSMPDHFSTDNTTFLSCVIDSVSLPITMENTASMAIVKAQQGQQAAIKTLVIGQQGLQTNFSNMTQTMNGIQTNVVQLQGDISGVQSQLTQTADSLTSTISEVARTAGTWRCMKTIDLTNTSTYNASKCYPVGIILPQNGDYGNDKSAAPVRIKVEAIFGDNSVYWSNHQNEQGGSDGKFSFSCTWTTLGGAWGEYWSAGDDGWKQNELNNETSTDTYRKIESFESEYVVGNVAGSIRQCCPTSEELIFLRGGAKYNIYTSWYIAKQDLNPDAENATYNITHGYIKAYPNGFSWSYTNPKTGITYYKTANAINQESIDVPIVDVRKYTEIEQTIDSISLNVFGAQVGAQGLVNKGQLQRTGIDIENGKITLEADNTDIIGNLNLRKTNNGLTVFDQNGLPKINVHPGSIGDPSNLPKTTINTNLGTSPRYNNAASVKTGDVPAAYLGYRGSGASITIDKLNFTSYYGNGTQWNGTINYKIHIKEGDINESDYKTYSGSTNTFTNVSINETFTCRGYDYYIVIDYDATFYGITNWWATPYFSYSTEVASLTDIGTDGIIVKQGSNKYSYFGPNSTELRMGTQGILMTGSQSIPLQRTGNNTLTPLGNIKRIRKSSNNGLIKASDDYDFYIFNAAPATGLDTTNKLQLDGYYPADGRTIWVKSTVSNTMKILGGSLIKIYDSNSRSTASEISIGNNATQLIYCSPYWYAFRQV